MKKAIFLDLDNTIYPVHSINNKLFKKLFVYIDESGEFSGDFEDVKYEIMRIPFQKVAEKFNFNKQLINECMAILVDLTYDEPMTPFPDYVEIRILPQKKFLVTSGFAKLQHSKINQLEIKNDFTSIQIIDPVHSDTTKKDIFLQIVKEYNYSFSEVLIVGDDTESEIKAGIELGIDTVLYDREGTSSNNNRDRSIRRFNDLIQYL